MSKLIYNAEGLQGVVKQLSNCSDMLDSTRKDVVTQINIIKNAHGSQYLNADYGWAISCPTEKQSLIHEMIDDLSRKAKIIEDYSNNLNGVSGLDRALYTAALFGLKGFEGFIGVGEELVDFAASATGLIAGAFGNTAYRDKQMAFVAKDHVGDAFSKQYEEGGMFATVNKYSYYDADSSAANVCKTAGSIAGSIALSAATGGATGAVAKVAGKTAIKAGTKEAATIAAKSAIKTGAKEAAEATAKKSSVKVAEKVVDMSFSFAGSAGGAMETNLQEGKTVKQSVKSSLGSAAKSTAVSVGLGKTGDKAGKAIEKLGTREASAVTKTSQKTVPELEKKTELVAEKFVKEETKQTADTTGKVVSKSIKNSTKAKKLYDASTEDEDDDKK